MTDIADDDLRAAAEAYAASIDALGELNDDELSYLARLNEVGDPLSDWVDCDDDMETG